MIMSKIKEIMRGVWQFVSYLFVPQWGSKRRQEQEALEEKFDKMGMGEEPLAQK